MALFSLSFFPSSSFFFFLFHRNFIAGDSGAEIGQRSAQSAESPPNDVMKWLESCELPTLGILARWDPWLICWRWVWFINKRGKKNMKEEFATLVAHIGSYDGIVFCLALIC